MRSNCEPRTVNPKAGGAGRGGRPRPNHDERAVGASVWVRLGFGFWSSLDAPRASEGSVTGECTENQIRSATAVGTRCRGRARQIESFHFFWKLLSDRCHASVVKLHAGARARARAPHRARRAGTAGGGEGGVGGAGAGRGGASERRRGIS